jgi:hypothetical protein
VSKTLTIGCPPESAPVITKPDPRAEAALISSAVITAADDFLFRARRRCRA